MDSIGGDPGIAPASMFEDIDTTIPGLARFAPIRGDAVAVP